MKGYAVTDRRADTVAPDRTPLRRIGFDDDLWQRLDEAAKKVDPDSNRSVVLRRFARWFVGDIDQVPQRPERDQGER